MKVAFNYYLHDSYTGTERAEYILGQTNLDMSAEEFNTLVGRPFYEVQLNCELDTDTGEVTVISAKL